MKCTGPVLAVKDMQSERAFYENLFWFESYQVNGFKHRIRRWAVATTEVLLVDGGQRTITSKIDRMTLSFVLQLQVASMYDFSPLRLVER